MKKLLLFGVAALGAWLAAQNAVGTKPLAGIVPAGAVLYLEAKNFNGLLGDWNAGREKAAWLQSANYQVFSRSMLFLRLKGVYDEYATAVGLPPDMNLLSSVAGGESALAIYSVNKLEFLYVTRLASAKAMQSVVWQARQKFTERSVAGVTYYVKSASDRTAAFAISGDTLLLATREDALTGALALIGGGSSPAVSSEPWFTQAVQSTGAAGELRMVMNMEKLVRTPSFRSYWVQQNITELSQFFAGIDDLQRTAAEMRENRVLLRQEPAAAVNADALRDLVKMIPATASVYRAWAQPSLSEALQRTTAVLQPGPSTVAETKTAPNVSIDSGLAGDENDLESRLEDAPFQKTDGLFQSQPLERMLAANSPSAMLVVGTSRMQADRVFVDADSVVVLQGTAPWNANAVRSAVWKAVESTYAPSGAPVAWRDRQGVSELDGLARIAIAVKGNVLLIGNRVEAVAAVLGASATIAPAGYVAGYRMSPEIGNYQRMMRLIEFPSMGDANAEPAFFSANLGSLADTLRRVQSVSLSAQDDGKAVKQTVSYRIGQ